MLNNKRKCVIHEITRNKVFNGEILMRGMERMIWLQAQDSRDRLKEDAFFIAYQIVLLNGWGRIKGDNQHTY